MNNRLHNCTNPYQGDNLKVLCVCSAGLLRSPTAANVLHKKYGYNTRAAGVDENYALVRVDEVLLSWAEEIVVMTIYEEETIKGLLEKYGIEDTVVVSLGISDDYAYMDDVLQREILMKYSTYLD